MGIKTHSENVSSKWPQIIAALSATIGAFGAGNVLAWSSPALPRIQSDKCLDDCDISNVSAEDASWIGSLVPLGAILAGPITGFLMTRWGRKWTMILLMIPFVTGYVLLLLAYYLDNKALLFVGRLVAGYAGGSFNLAAPLYIVEISEQSIRGSLASIMQFNVTTGVAFIYGLSINYTIPWYHITAICIIPPVLMSVCMFFMPESPAFLLSRGKDAEALASLQRLRGEQYDPRPEMDQMKEQQAKERDLGAISFKELFTQEVYLKPFVLVFMLMGIQQLTGINAVIFYTETIFADAGSEMDAGLSSFIVGFAQIIGTGLAVLVVEQFGRRLLLLISTAFMGISILVLGVFFYMKENMTILCPDMTSTTVSAKDTSEESCTGKEGKFDEDLVKTLGWLPLISMICYILAFSIGNGPLAWTVNAEIFSPEAKAVGSSSGLAFNWFFAFIVTKFEPGLEELIHASGVYFLFAVVCAISFMLIFFFLPETKGKSSEELKQGFMSKKKRPDPNAMSNPAYVKD